MLSLLKQLFDTKGFMPRRNCGNWSIELIWFHLGSDVLISLAYLTIPIALIYFVRCRRDLPFPRIFWMFSAFIVSCGVTHFLDAAAFYWPAYRLMGVLKFITAILSWTTVVALVLTVPRVLALAGSQELHSEIAVRKQAEAKFRGLLESAPDAVVIVRLVWPDRPCELPDRNDVRIRASGAVGPGGRGPGVGAVSRHTSGTPPRFLLLAAGAVNG